MRNLFILVTLIISSFTLRAQLSDAKKDEFNKFITQADALFSEGKFVEAKDIYEKAIICRTYRNRIHWFKCLGILWTKR